MRARSYRTCQSARAASFVGPLSSGSGKSLAVGLDEQAVDQRPARWLSTFSPATRVHSWANAARFQLVGVSTFCCGRGTSGIRSRRACPRSAAWSSASGSRPSARGTSAGPRRGSGARSPLVRLERADQHVARRARLLPEHPLPRGPRPARPPRSGPAGRAWSSAVFELGQELADAAGLDRLDLQAREPAFEPVRAARGTARPRAGPAGASPSAGASSQSWAVGAEQERVLEALGLQVAEQVLVGPQAGGRRRAGSGPTC